MIETIEVGATGGTPGADSNDYKLFDTTVTFTGGGLTRVRGITRVTIVIQNDQAGTLKAYWSNDKGTNWDQYDSQTVAIPAAGASSGPYDYDVAPFDDFKLVWTNGGSAQTTWRVQIVMLRGIRSPAT